jgi:L-ascorbate metabolism protein UlaG (beta-lactamase superfamily)
LVETEIIKIAKKMYNKKFYLKQNIKIEPLINLWYAWIHIIPPITAAFNIVEKHIRMMESYIRSPELHAAAILNSSMRGGPFIDLEGKQVNQVKDLLEQTKQKAKLQFDFVRAVRNLDDLLEKQAKGFSLEQLYSQIPEILQGYVELFYDRHHRPDFKFFEALLYRSHFYESSFQSVTMSSIHCDHDRPFIFSTPILSDEKAVHLTIPFSSPGLDELFKSKNIPQSLDFIRNQLAVEIEADKESIFQSFFTTIPPQTYKKYSGDKMRIRYFGHACILIETENISILIDPVISYKYDTDIPRFTYQDIPDEIDYVLITHSHHDHILMETMLQIRYKVRNIVVPKNSSGVLQDPSLKLLLSNLGFSCVRDMQELDTIVFEDGEITALPFIGEHHDLLVNSKLAYHIRFRDSTVLVAADSCNISPPVYEHIHCLLGNVDLLFLGMECDGAPISWVYGPVFTNKPEREKDFSRRGRGSNYTEGMNLVHCFDCKEVYVYAMGEEPWIQYILDVSYTETSNPIVQSNLLVEQCIYEGRVAERLFAAKEIYLEA